jgi:single-strand DNA-binding protein
MNAVHLTGRLVKDPEMRFTPSGVAVTNLTLAVQRNFKNEQGEYEADFINITIWRNAAEIVANHMKKGDMAGFSGRIQTRHYEGQDGKRVYVTEVVADDFDFLQPKKEEPQQPQQNNNRGNYNNRGGRR